MARKKQKKDSEWKGWTLIVVLFVLGLWPLALAVLFWKLFGKNGDAQAAPSLERGEETAVSRQRFEAAGNAARQLTRSPLPGKSTSRWLKIIGAVVMLGGLFACGSPLDMMFWLEEIDGYYVRELLSCLAVAVAGGAMFFSGISMDRAMKRYAKYLAVMGEREAMAVEELARTLGFPERRVQRDLQRMIDKGYFGGKAYLNVELGYLFRSGQADAEFKRRRQEEQEKRPSGQAEGESEYDRILKNIRRANDDIADEALSAKIDRLEEITAKIFQAVREDPGKEKQIGTFLNYYLPTTQKLLDSYAQFESAGVEGENLKQAKSRIEVTMDAIVRGFERQLDELYKADALDVDSDLRVMESMLHRDGASVQQDFGVEE